MFLRTALLVLRKDFAIELKSCEILSTTLFFAVSCVLVFSFAFVKEGRAVEDAAAGILWIAIAFSGTLALGRTFERERYGETLQGAAAGAGAAAGDLRRQAARHRRRCWSSTEMLLVPLVACCSARRCSRGRCCSARCSLAARSASRRSGRCSPPCWCGRGRATCCCRSCCIRSRFR